MTEISLCASTKRAQQKNKSRTSVTFADGQPEAASVAEKPVIPKSESDESGRSDSQGEDYLRLGHKLTALTERMGSMTREIQKDETPFQEIGDDEIPFIDNGEGAEDYTKIARTRDGENEISATNIPVLV